jgi:hypothetical protein
MRLGPATMSKLNLRPISPPETLGLRGRNLWLNDFGAGVYRVLHVTQGVTPPPQPPPPAVQVALARLVGVIRTLCTPGQGWPSDRPQTPENLLPYVSDEAEELLDHWQQGAGLDGDGQRSVPKDHRPALGQTHSPILVPDLSRNLPDPRPLADLCSACLWGITASSYEVMRFLEGVEATVKISEAVPWSGVRLAPCLCFESPGLDWTMDIVTQALLTEGTDLPDTALIALTADDLVAPPRTGQQWIHRFWQAIEQQQPLLRSLRQGWEITLLLPHQDWCQGRLTLGLKLVGLSQPHLADYALAPSALTAPQLSGFRPQSPPHLTSRLQFTQADWLDRFHDQVLSALPLSPGISAPSPLLTLVTIAHERMVRTQSPQLFSPALGTTPITLQMLWPRLRWLALQPDTPLMPLLGGVAAAYLSPGQYWTVGLLQARLSLQLQQDATFWWLDLSTGEWHTPTESPPPGTVLKMAADGPLAPLAAQVWPWEAFQAELIATLCQESPALRVLWAGTTVRLEAFAQEPDQHEDPDRPATLEILSATMGLHLEISFQPASEA